MLQLDLPWLLVLLPAPLLVWLFLPAAKKQDTALRVPFFATLSHIDNQQIAQGQITFLQRILAILIWALLVVCASKPQWVGEPIPLPTEGRDLMIAVDLSGSMQEEDMEYRSRLVRRIDIVKHVVSDFVEKRETDRLGLILFGTSAYLQAPLTFDRETVKTLLMESELGFAGNQTAIGDALGLAIKRLQERPASSRVLILLTDGQNTAGEVDPREAAELAKLAEVKIYTIGVASDRVIQDNRGFFSRRRQADADLDENTLNFIAETTGGQYFRAKDSKELAQIYKVLNEIEPIEQNDEVFRPIQALYFWPMGAALALSFILGLLFVNWQHLATLLPMPSTRQTKPASDAAVSRSSTPRRVNPIRRDQHSQTSR